MVSRIVGDERQSLAPGFSQAGRDLLANIVSAFPLRHREHNHPSAVAAQAF